MRSRMEFCRTSMDDPLQGGQGRCGGRGSFASVHISDLFEMFTSRCPSESIEIPMPRLRLSDQRRSEWSEINRHEARPYGDGPLLLRISVEGSQPARSGSSLFEEASSTKPETASSIYSASSRLDGVVDIVTVRRINNFNQEASDDGDMAPYVVEAVHSAG